MIIRSLELSNFRNYGFLNLTFDKGTNILYGDNAQGKTNILEAIYRFKYIRLSLSVIPIQDIRPFVKCEV